MIRRPPIVQRAVVALGANLGDREGTLAAAVRELAGTEGIELVAVSSLHDTTALKPHGYDDDAPRYLNAVALVETRLSPLELLDACMAIERAHGRVRTGRWGDRSLDLDVIAVGDQRISLDRLILPHPHAHERDFVLRPWLEVDPEAVLPGRGRVAELLASIEAERTPAGPEGSGS